MSEDIKNDGDTKKRPVKLQIKAAEEVSKGTYSNMALVHNNEAEFVLDFVFAEPQRPQGQLVSRVVTNPKAAKKLAQGLSEMVRRYEERFGEIKLPVAPAAQGSYH